MPTYHYKCENCDYEVFLCQKFSDAPLKKCPECTKHSLCKIISGGLGFFARKDPTTLGQLRDKNHKKFGRQKVLENAIEKGWVKE